MREMVVRGNYIVIYTEGVRVTFRAHLARVAMVEGSIGLIVAPRVWRVLNGWSVAFYGLAGIDESREHPDCQR